MHDKKPKIKTVILSAAIIIAATIVGFFIFSGGVEAIKNFSGGKFLILIVAAAALIDSINPCAFSVLLLTIALLFSMGNLRRQILKTGSFYIFGIFLVYILIGLGILKTLSFLNIPHFMAKVGAGVIIFAGLLNLINHFFPSFPIKLRIPQSAHLRMARLMEKASLPTAFFLGVLVGMYEFPCTGGPYLMVLGFLHDNATYLKGFGYLILYNLFFILPLVIILLVVSNKSLLEKAQIWRKENTGQMRIWGGIAMIILGLVIFIL